MTDDERALTTRLEAALTNLDKAAFVTGLLMGGLMNVRLMASQVNEQNDGDDSALTMITKAIDAIRAEAYPLIDAVYYPNRKPPADTIK